MRSILLGGAVLLLAGCSNLPYRIASKANDYTYFEQKFEAECKEATQPCLARAKKLGACIARLNDAADAAKRGGAAKYQEKAMRAACSEKELR